MIQWLYIALAIVSLISSLDAFKPINVARARSSTHLNALPLDIDSQSLNSLSTTLSHTQFLLASGMSTVKYNPIVYFIAGGICASFSHAVGIPIDVVKTKQQTDNTYKEFGTLGALQKVIDEDGYSALLNGAAPTVVGYSIQGSIKYGLYEYFKPFAAAVLTATGITEFLGDNDSVSTILDFCLSGAAAELIGSSFLAPFEAARIRSVSNPEYANGLVETLQKMVDNEGPKSPFLGLPAILSKQIPFTMVSLSAFEVISKYIYQTFLGLGSPIVSNPTIGTAISNNAIGSEVDTNLGTVIVTSAETALVTLESIDFSTRFSVTLFAALIAGVLGAIVSQPGDTLLSVVNKSTKSSTGSSSTAVSTKKAVKARESSMVSSSLPLLGGLQEGLDGLKEDIGGRVGSLGEALNLNDDTSTSTSSMSASAATAAPEVDAILIMKEAIDELGLKGLFGGFQARLFHVMVIVTIQLLVYDYTKSAVGSIIG